MDVDLSQNDSTSQSVQNTDSSAFDSASQQQMSEQVAQQIAELDKMQKFKFQGQEWTPKDLERAILRQKDYTQRTQKLAEERKALESEKSERQFYENLYADLRIVKAHPNLASEFLKTYPEKFHQALKEVLSESQGQTQEQNQMQRPTQDLETMTRLAKLEKFYEQQEQSRVEQDVMKHETQINTWIDQFSKKYPDAHPELVVARIHEAYQRGTVPNQQTFEDTFKQVEAQEKQRLSARYGDLVKKQTQANNKGRDVESGGGTVGRAPPKFKSLKEVTDFAVGDLTGNR